ncbi:UDP-N-acetylmuramate--L-alanine ligase [Nonlabens tegetincola]|uniref:UDP-N-acetylmuramate--L-alanine ligase n=1 Tax=Nonlabens tegetincola TaxID=323273 RepID=UPI000A2077BE|nr:UDP-N-acetylmuramate--L-alanine ligase [Nonlabens tegetincola]ARN70333.1 UDP-N-acetylmuramate--L-alanine ligase [Nonlabens tegetincola]
MSNLDHISHFYFIGIGGIGMSALARYLKQAGKNVAGYDKTPSALTEQLVSEGINIHYQDDYDSIPAQYKDVNNAQVIYTPAIPVDFGELVRFRESGITILKRAQLLGQISKTMTCLAVAGTHGKTTTSAILTHLLYESKVPMTAFCGGIIEKYNTNYIHTGNEVMVVEADEFDRSFMNLQPEIAGVTAMDADHLDIYGDVEEFEKTFEDFAALVPQGNLLTTEVVSLPGKKVGFNNGDYQILNYRIQDESYYFDFKTPNQLFENIKWNLPGKHNLSNAALAMSMALEYGVQLEKLIKALGTFPGVDRRFTYRLNSDELVLIDDYAHHPTEINAVFQAVNELYPDEEKLVVFQPHLYSRTKDFMDDFARSLAQFDQVYLLDIYPARELPIPGITSQSLQNRIEKITSGITSMVTKDQLENELHRSNKRIICMLGAGDIGVEIKKIAAKWVK